MPGQGMCNRILHSQKKQGRAFGVAPHDLDAAGQTFAEALHIKVRVDVVADVPQTRPKFLNSLRPGLPLLRHCLPMPDPSSPAKRLCIGA